MRNFCIPKEQIPNLKKELKDSGLTGGIKSIEQLTSEQRVELFSRAVGSEIATPLNKSFEEAVAEKKVKEITKWVKNNLDEKYRNELVERAQKQSLQKFLTEKTKSKSGIVPLKDVVSMKEGPRSEFLKKYLSDKQITEFNDKIEKKDEESVLKEYFLGSNIDISKFDSHIESKLARVDEQIEGIGLSEEDAVELTTLARDFYEKGRDVGKDIGDIDSMEKTEALFEAYSKLEEKKLSLLPKSKLKSWVTNYGKAAMVGRVSTNFLNIIGNTEYAVTERATRRLATGTFFSDVDSDVVNTAKDALLTLYDNTGVDITRMDSIKNYVSGAGKIAGEEIGSNDTGLSIANDFSKLAFGALGWVDSRASVNNFLDSAGIYSTYYANKDGGDATELFKDSMRLEPKTEVGQEIRKKAISDAKYATGQNNSMSAKASKDIRSFLNRFSEPLMLGDMIMPLVQTGSAFAEASADFAGLGFFKAGSKGYYALKSKDISKLDGAFKDIARSGLGMTIAAIISSLIDPEDFIGLYDSDEIKIANIGNTNFNMIRVGDTWVSLDYAGPFGNALIAFMYAKKYDSNNVADYITGSISSYLSMLPAAEATKIADVITTAGSMKEGSGAKVLESIAKVYTDQLGSRFLPGFVGEITRLIVKPGAQDTSPTTDYKFIERVARSLGRPLGVNPIKTDIFGRELRDDENGVQGRIGQLVFGSRGRGARTDTVTEEMFRLNSVSSLPSMTDMKITSSPKESALKEKVGQDKFKEIYIEHGQNLYKAFENEIKKPSYKKLSDEDKSEQLSNISSDLRKRTLGKYGIK